MAALAHLGQAMRQDKSKGKPLKTVWKSLTNATAVFRRGNLVLVGGGSGVGKSAFALTLAIQSGAKTIYFSADSGPDTQLSRSMSMVTGRPAADCMRAIEKGHFFDNELFELRRIRWDFDAGPTLDDIEQSLDAYGFLHGEYPELVIVDNLLNVVSEDSGEGGHKTNENILLFLSELARERGCCIVVLHHLTGDYDDGDKAPPMSALRDKVSKIPQMILTLYRIDDLIGNLLGVCIVKNRGGRANASGKYQVELDLDLSTMTIKDMEMPDRQLPT